MVIVLMDTKHHKTIQVSYPALRYIVPVMITQTPNGHQLMEKPYPEAVFARYGELAGDPVYLQVSGPEVPSWFWGCGDYWDHYSACEG